MQEVQLPLLTTTLELQLRLQVTTTTPTLEIPQQLQLHLKLELQLQLQPHYTTLGYNFTTLHYARLPGTTLRYTALYGEE